MEQFQKDIAEGFAVTGADCLFLDVRTPWDYLEHIPAAVIPGAMLGFLLPTTNQVQDLLEGLHAGPFSDIEVLEILIRRYKTVPQRLRPDDRMVAHTGFLVFARCLAEPKEPGAAKAEGEDGGSARRFGRGGGRGVGRGAGQSAGPTPRGFHGPVQKMMPTRASSGWGRPFFMPDPCPETPGAEPAWA